MLILAGEAADDDETRYALRTLAHQVALALSSAELSAEVHRRASEARFATLVQNSSDLITVLDANNTVLYQSPSIERVLGYTVDEVTGRPFEQLLHPDEQGRLLRRLTDGAGATGRAEVIDCLLAHKDGSLRHFEILHADLLSDSAVGGIVLNGRDVSERKAFEEQLAHQAFHDPVTHLANRALFNERVRHAVARTLREGVGMAVLFVDLDDFKTVNDSLGHAVGDRVLLEVAQRISASVRAADTAARFGGDEFAILLEDVARSAGGGGDRRAHPRLARPSARARQQPPDHPRQPRHLGRRAGQRHRRRRADPQRGCRDVHRQGRGEGRLPPVRARDARPRGGAPCAARRSTARARARGVRASLPAPGAASGRGRHRRRGAPALASSRTRADPTVRVHSVRRGERADRRHRPLGAPRRAAGRRRSCGNGSRARRCRRSASTSRSSSCSTPTSSPTWRTRWRRPSSSPRP